MAEQSKKQARRKSDLIFAVVIAAAAAVLAVSVWHLASGGAQYAQGVRIYSEIRARAAGGELEADGEITGRVIDFGALYAMNPDTAGWITLPDTPVDYPVVQGADNDYYLDRAFDGTQNSSGSIFMDAANAADFSDQNTVVYGHNMKNGSMFAALHNYEKESWYLGHPLVYVVTPDGKTHEYRVFAAFETTDMRQPTAFASEAGFLEYAANARAATAYATDVATAPGDKILTLSTCVQGEGGSRFVVMAVLSN